MNHTNVIAYKIYMTSKAHFSEFQFNLTIMKTECGTLRWKVILSRK